MIIAKSLRVLPVHIFDHIAEDIVSKPFYWVIDRQVFSSSFEKLNMWQRCSTSQCDIFIQNLLNFA